MNKTKAFCVVLAVILVGGNLAAGSAQRFFSLTLVKVPLVILLVGLAIFVASRVAKIEFNIELKGKKRRKGGRKK